VAVVEHQFKPQHVARARSKYIVQTIVAIEAHPVLFLYFRICVRKPAHFIAAVAILFVRLLAVSFGCDGSR